MAVCMSLSATLLTGCSDDDEKVNEPETPEEKPEEKPSEEPDQPEEPEVKNTYRFAPLLCAKNHGGMSQNKNGTFVRSVPALTADQPMVEFSGKGIDITQSYTMESITKGKYYYQVPQSPADRFSKFQILTDAEGDEYIQTVAEVPFKENTYYARKYTHAWTDDATLVIVGTDAAHKVVYWSKLKDTDTSLSIESEGTLDIPHEPVLFLNRQDSPRYHPVGYVHPLHRHHRPGNHESGVEPAGRQSPGRGDSRQCLRRTDAEHGDVRRAGQSLFGLPEDHQQSGMRHSAPHERRPDHLRPDLQRLPAP